MICQPGINPLQTVFRSAEKIVKTHYVETGKIRVITSLHKRSEFVLVPLGQHYIWGSVTFAFTACSLFKIWAPVLQVKSTSQIPYKSSYNSIKAPSRFTPHLFGRLSTGLPYLIRYLQDEVIRLSDSCRAWGHEVVSSFSSDGLSPAYF